jgi:hypothetical protein
MSKKVSACRTEVRVIYHCNIGDRCDYFIRNYAGAICDYLHVEDSTCTCRSAQRQGRKAARQRGATA